MESRGLTATRLTARVTDIPMINGVHQMVVTGQVGKMSGVRLEILKIMDTLRSLRAVLAAEAFVRRPRRHRV